MYKRAGRELYPSQYATVETKGREVEIQSDKFRSEFQRDTHRILYSQSFRRLRHKTQVFYFPQNDHVSTRLDHVLFVASAARTVARCLGLNEDLTEAIGLAHDIGHAPFGHQGEIFLNNIIKTYPNLRKIIPSFSHEIYGLRVVDKIAKRDREKPGLNLTWEVRDGIISHCGEDFDKCKLTPVEKNKKLEKITNRDEAGYPTTLEGCIVRLVDKVAYCGKDIEDAIASKIINENQIPNEIKNELGEVNGKIIGTILENMIEQSKGKNHIEISTKYGNLMHNLIEFNNQNIYHCSKSESYSKQAEQTLKLLFEDLLNVISDTKRFKKSTIADHNSPKVYKILKEYCDEYCDDKIGIYSNNAPNELIVFDFIAGMTDTFAVRSFKELFVPKATV